MRFLRPFANLATRTPEWASSISGVPVEEIEAFARKVGQTKRSFFRLGYGFTRSRNGAAQMHAALCIPTVTGAWQYEGGGAIARGKGRGVPDAGAEPVAIDRTAAPCQRMGANW